MRKFFTVILIFAVFSSGVYAEIVIGGSVSSGVTILKGTNIRGDVLGTGNFLSGSIDVSGQDEEDTFGGDLSINAEASTTDPAAWAWSASVWWKPLYFMKLQLGYIDDFALTDIVGWGFHANDAESFVVSPKNNYAGDYFSDTTGFYSGTGSGWTGFTLSITPIYGLDINIAVPFGRGADLRDPISGDLIQKYNAADAYLYTSAQIAYTLWGFGRFAVSYANGGNGKLEFLADTSINAEVPDPYTGLVAHPYDPINDTLQLYRVKANAPSLYASFFLDAFEDMGFSANIGFAYTFPVFYENTSVVYNSPMEVGLGISFGTDRMGIKARMGASLMGSLERFTNQIINEPMMLGLGILPYYGFGPFMFYLNAGVSYKWEDEIMFETSGSFRINKMGNSAALGWYANPYMTFTLGSGRFYAGIQVESDGLKYVGYNKDQISIIREGDYVESYPGQPIIDWAIPIGILFEF